MAAKIQHPAWSIEYQASAYTARAGKRLVTLNVLAAIKSAAHGLDRFEWRGGPEGNRRAAQPRSK